MLEIVKTLAERAMKTGKPASDVVEDRILMTLQKKELIELARVGLVFLINDHLHKLRVPSLYVDVDEEDTGNSISVKVEKAQMQTSVTTSVWTVIFDKIYYQGADGSQKPLREFTKEDCRFLAADCESKSKAYNDLADWFSRAERTLEKYHVAKIKDLPESVKEQLAKEFPRGPLS